jgi:chemotaxis protein CheC
VLSDFSAEERDDALREVVNIGMGAAGAALAETLGVFVRLSVPKVRQVDATELLSSLTAPPWNDRPVNASSQAFYGALSGNALVIFDETGVEQLADLLGHDDGEAGAARANEVLLELGNIMTGACVNGIAVRLNHPISFAPPVLLCEGTPLAAVLSPGDEGARRTLLVSIEFAIEERKFDSRIAILISEKAIAALDRAIETLLADLAG